MAVSPRWVLAEGGADDFITEHQLGGSKRAGTRREVERLIRKMGLFFISMRGGEVPTACSGGLRWNAWTENGWERKGGENAVDDDLFRRGTMKEGNMMIGTLS